MRQTRRWTSTASIFALAWGGFGLVLMCASAALAQQPGYSPHKKSWTDSITSPFSKLGDAFKSKPSMPKPIPENDAVSLNSKAELGPEFFVAIARLQEKSGRMDEARQQYQLALQKKPNYLAAMLGLAQLEESAGKPDEAIRIYQAAIQAHPKEASVYNNYGLCLARQNRLGEAYAAIRRAVELAPKNPLYRNNIATVLVDQNNFREALLHLQAVHSEAAANYNMGYLLNKKGQTREAREHFAMAYRADPSMDAARRWVAYLDQSARQPQRTAAATPSNITPPSITPPSVTSPAIRWGEGERSSETVRTFRLPPTAIHQAASDDLHMLDAPKRSTPLPAAPLPPQTESALRPLPPIR